MAPPQDMAAPPPAPASGAPDPLRDGLNRWFGHPGFRPGQRPVIEAMLGGRDVVAIMPTGGGKSLCYQLPAVMGPGLTIVVSPLIALMKDQVDALRGHGIPAAFVNSSQDPRERALTLDDAREGRIKLLYVAPERFRNPAAMSRLEGAPIDRFVVDEAHCISAWGHDFRPDYLELGPTARRLGAKTLGAFTATATDEVRRDIVQRLGLRDPHVTVSGFFRDNLHLSVVPIKRMKEKGQALKRVLEGLGGAAVVYAATRRHVEEVGATLRAAGHRAYIYHAGLDDQARHAAQDAFLADPEGVIVATNAFGMGVDKPDVRAVVHWELPGSLEAYYQEAGRAGRDGQDAACVLLFTYADTRIHEFFIQKGAEERPLEARAGWAQAEEQKLRQMVRYAYEEGCRHEAILRYFGDASPFDPGEGCGLCDRCTSRTGLGALDRWMDALDSGGGRTRRREAAQRDDAPVDPRAITEEEAVVVAKILSAVARAQGRLTPTVLGQVLRGATTTDAMTDPLAATKSYGMLRGMRQGALVAVLRALGRAGCTEGRRPRLTRLGQEVMWQRERVTVDIGPFAPKAGRSRSAGNGTATEAPLDADDRAVLEALKAARIDAARERGVPAYVVASNRVLREIATQRPGDARDTWLALHGVGQKNVDPLREVFGPVLDELEG